MPRFEFSLSTLLRLREHDEQQAAFTLAAAEARLREARALIEAIEARITQAQGAFEQDAAGPTSATAMHDHIRYLRRLCREREEAEERRKRLEAQRDQDRRVHVEARKKVRVLERLRERQYRQHLQTEEQAERAWLDEVGMRRHGRGLPAGRATTNVLMMLFIVLVFGALYYFFFTDHGQQSLRYVTSSSFMSPPDGRTGRVATMDGAPPAESPASRILSASDVMNLPAEELSRILNQAGQKMKEEWDRLVAWEERMGAMEQELNDRQASLAAMQREVTAAAQVVEASLAKLNTTLETERSAEAQAQQDRYDMIAKMVAAMNAREAARLFVNADEELAYNVLSRLNARVQGEILNEVSRPGVGTADDAARLMALVSRTPRTREDVGG